jgi:hypothetical protein
VPVQPIAQGVVPVLFEAVSAAEVKQNGSHLNKEEEVFLYSIGIEVEGARKTLMSDLILTAGILRLSLRSNHSDQDVPHPMTLPAMIEGTSLSSASTAEQFIGRHVKPDPSCQKGP